MSNDRVTDPGGALIVQAEPADPPSPGKLLVGSTKQEGDVVNEPSPSRIALEHNFAKLVPFRSSHGTGGKDSSFPTVVLFADRITSKLKSKKAKRHLKLDKIKVASSVDNVHGSHGEVNSEEAEGNAIDVEVADR